ncbi:peptidase U32 family protein [Ureaplasma canigenitalium]|uniref:peptidase U32 family protein n=1 Tax=Ureaplasma canigenitalium TaxID=42092 RepID=UPI00068FDBC3|nr:U32 family peptidase [Ureaplasma canigenitalium]
MMKNKKYIPELLAPAGDYEKAIYALTYGADAVFVGLKSYSLRARASNFELDNVRNLIEFAHQNHKKVYIVTNVICHNPLLRGFPEFISSVVSLKPDGYIVADPYIINFIRKNHPSAEIHISTQQSITNSKAALFFKRNGASRVVLSREMTLDELKLYIKNNNHQIETEVFIHGAVCIAYSGRCMMSNNFSLRDANVGGCAHACRWKYNILDEKNSYDDLPSKFSMSAKDMVQLKNIKNLMDLEIDSFKIEGRMKSVHYIATVVATYRKVIDSYLTGTSFDLTPYLFEIENAMNRKADVAFMNGQPDMNLMLYHEKQEVVIQNFIFVIDKYLGNNQYLITSKNNFHLDYDIEIFGPKHDKVDIKIKKIYDVLNENEIDVVKTPMMQYIIEIEKVDTVFDVRDIGRIKHVG